MLNFRSIQSESLRIPLNLALEYEIFNGCNCIGESKYFEASSGLTWQGSVPTFCSDEIIAGFIAGTHPAHFHGNP